MEKTDHLIKREGNTRCGSSSFSETRADYSYPFSGMFDISQGEEKDYSLGFMELLGVGVGQDYCPTSLFDYLPQTPSTVLPSLVSTMGGKDQLSADYSSLNQQPATPNSSSISSESSEAVNEEHTDHKAAADQEENNSERRTH